MRTVDLIEKKVHGSALTAEEITFLINGYVDGSIPDYQMSAFLMAVVFQDMTEQEAADLTFSMMHSGDVADLSDLPGVKVDKHSTGGVGDTTTLVVAPLVAACGATVAKMSGRGLGHTGGTLDKLETIPGLRVEQTPEKFKEIVRQVGVAVIGQSGDLVPADKKMYALRDVTATVRSIPLIAASIMSKKLASGADAIVLDVKTGTGAFAETEQEASRLAHLMVRMGALLGRRVSAIVTDMNQPLGAAIGNAVELREAVQLLSGMIPKDAPLYQVSMLLASQMLLLSGLSKTEAEAQKALENSIVTGAGLQKLREMVQAEGGDGQYIDAERIEALCRVRREIPFSIKREGYLADMDAEKIGTAAQLIGAGRAKKDDRIDPAVGIIMHKRIGDWIDLDEPILTIHINDETNSEDAFRLLGEAFTISKKKPAVPSMVYEIITE